MGWLRRQDEPRGGRLACFGRLAFFVLAISGLLISCGGGGGGSGDGGSSQPCITFAANGICGPYNYPQITGSNGNNTNIQNDVWNPIAGWQQTLDATDPGDWYVTANMPHYTGVVSYPDTNQFQYTSALSSYSYMYSSFAETSDHSSNTIADNGYDLWFDNYGREVMIQHDIINRSACTTYMTVLAANVSFGGSHGVPVNTWNLCKNGSSETAELVWQITAPPGATTFGITSGSVDIYAMLTWLVNQSYLPADPAFSAVQYGFEIGSTNGVSEKFAVTSFSLTAGQ
jgi:hypothetical protein